MHTHMLSDLELAFVCSLLSPFDGTVVDIPIMEGGRSLQVTADNKVGIYFGNLRRNGIRTVPVKAIINEIVTITTVEVICIRGAILYVLSKPFCVWDITK